MDFGSFASSGEVRGVDLDEVFQCLPLNVPLCGIAQFCPQHICLPHTEQCFLHTRILAGFSRPVVRELWPLRPLPYKKEKAKGSVVCKGALPHSCTRGLLDLPHCREGEKSRTKKETGSERSRRRMGSRFPNTWPDRFSTVASNHALLSHLGRVSEQKI